MELNDAKRLLEIDTNVKFGVSTAKNTCHFSEKILALTKIFKILNCELFSSLKHIDYFSIERSLFIE